MSSVLQEEVVFTTPDPTKIGPSLKEIDVNIVKATTVNTTNLLVSGAFAIGTLAVTTLNATGTVTAGTLASTGAVTGATSNFTGLMNAGSINTAGTLTAGSIVAPTINTNPSEIPGGTYQNVAHNVQTADATVTTVTTVPTISGSSQIIDYAVTYISGANTGALTQIAKVKNVAGTVTILSMQTSAAVDAALAGTAAALVISGSNVLLRVTGLAATTIKWTAGMKIVSQAA